MFSSLRSRLWLTYALSIATALFVVAVIFIIYLLGNPLIYRQTRLRLAVVQSEMIASQAGWSNLPITMLQSSLATKDKELDARLLVINTKHRIIADSRLGTVAGFEAKPFFRILRINQTVNDTQGQPWLFISRKLDNGNFLVTAVPRPKVSFWNILTDELMPPLFWAAVLGLFFALFIAFWMARWVADPLQRVVYAAHEFSGGDAKPLPLQGPQEVKELVGAFNKMTARVQASQRVQREFVADVSHELKTPLTAIQGFSRAILDGTAATPDQRKQSAQVILNEAERMHRMVVDLLDLARLDAGIADLKCLPVDMAALLSSVGERFALQARKAGVTLEIRATSSLFITGDGDRLAQVFTNLVDNALKFTAPGGLVSVVTADIPGAAEISVIDNGAGIPPESLPRVFDRFYQADASRQGGKKHGAGLGLSIVQEIVRAHGGKISVRSTVGQGTEFVVWLPFANPNASTSVRLKK